MILPVPFPVKLTISLFVLVVLLNVKSVLKLIDKIYTVKIFLRKSNIDIWEYFVMFYDKSVTSKK
jgi:hypothetical protein